MTDSLNDILLIGIAVAFLLVVIAFAISLLMSKGAIPENQKTITPVVGPLTVNKGMFITAAILFIIAALPIGFIIDFSLGGPGSSSSTPIRAGVGLGAAIFFIGVVWFVYGLSLHKSWHNKFRKILKALGFTTITFVMLDLIYLAYIYSIPGNHINYTLAGSVVNQNYYDYLFHTEPYTTIFVFFGTLSLGLWLAFFLGKKEQVK